MPGDHAGELPTFRAPVPIRCCEEVKRIPSVEFCASVARWQRAGGELVSAFYCDRHMRPGDTAIASRALVRRVRIVCEVVMSAVTYRGPEAQTEALDRLLEAVHGIHGELNLHGASSELGHYEPPTPPGGPKGNRGAR